MILAAFRVRSFRFQFPADLLTSWAFEMETLILGWYVIVQTESALLLTVFASLQFLGTLAAPMCGVLADRVGVRFMLCTMRATYLGLAALLMLLAFTGWLTPAWVIALAALSGIVRPNDQVMRNTLIGETIAPGDLMGALGLSRATMDSARVGGALAGAGLSTFLGMGTTYAFVTLFYAASLALTFGVARGRAAAPSPSPVRGLPAPGSGWGDLKDALAHVLARPRLLALLWLAFLINLTAYPVSGGLLPYVARQVYQADATALGSLVAAFSLGALIASIGMVLTRGPRQPERFTLVFTVLWYVLLAAFGQVQSMPLGLLVLFAAGFVQSVAMISMAAALLIAADPAYRARVMGVRMLAVYGLPLGLLAAGALIERIGYAPTISALVAVGLAGTVLIGVRWRAAVWRRATAAGATSAQRA